MSEPQDYQISDAPGGVPGNPPPLPGEDQVVAPVCAQIAAPPIQPPPTIAESKTIPTVTITTVTITKGPEQVTAPPVAPPIVAMPLTAGSAPKAKVPTEQTEPAPASDPQSIETLSEESITSVSEALGAIPSWLVSMIVHMMLFIALGLWPILNDDLYKTPVVHVPPLNEMEDEAAEEDAELQPDIQPEKIFADDALKPDEELEVATMIEDTDHITLEDDIVDQSSSIEPEELSGDLTIYLEGANRLGTGKNILEGRGGKSKGELVREGGGSGPSERAVQLALKWLANHQQQDGGWSFDHRVGGRCDCGNHGSFAQTRIAATAMAVLPFMGAGHTPRTGKYKRVVSGAIAFLVKHQAQNGSFHEPRGQMYSHGLASIAICEAYAMTGDRSLVPPAQRAINFIVRAQDPAGGGWRYSPRQPGDTSVVGWQVMALVSARMSSGIQVPGATLKKVNLFLDHVQSDYGAQYGYTGPGTGDSRTAIGLLSRMYLGWKHDNQALKRGIEYLSKTGPSQRNMYYNYYATQAMHHFGGKPWRKWNSVMRDSLIKSQNQAGHATGSWYMQDQHGGHTGGRLYCTAMATMILEVYYRHLPLYKKNATDQKEFILD